jgi:HrpA-like RNA helicase
MSHVHVTVILDEVHERNLDSDFLITLLKDLLPRRPDLKCDR